MFIEVRDHLRDHSSHIFLLAIKEHLQHFHIGYAFQTLSMFQNTIFSHFTSALFL